MTKKFTFYDLIFIIGFLLIILFVWFSVTKYLKKEDNFMCNYCGYNLSTGRNYLVSKVECDNEYIISYNTQNKYYIDKWGEKIYNGTEEIIDCDKPKLQDRYAIERNNTIVYSPQFIQCPVDDCVTLICMNGIFPEGTIPCYEIKAISILDNESCDDYTFTNKSGTYLNRSKSNERCL